MIVLYMTSFKKEVFRRPGESGRERYWKVEYDLWVVVEGRNLRYYARLPGDAAMQGMGQVSISAAFLPGTE
jgi:hypothetical protein